MPGLHKDDPYWIANDFDDPLPDEFWLGEDAVHGTKYVIIGDLHTPSDRTVTILTVWIIDIGTDSPRFITARPFKPNSEVHRD
ncbi:DUF6883 domain-containing protein [Halomicronema hongdechloris]|uniref:DUF6883 domain-containing protein n=1 Tax=Halomicronema hongdechloris TaxID=1209493 RepID=UPI0037038C14